MPEVSPCAGSGPEPLLRGDGRAQRGWHWLVKFWLEVSVWDEPKGNPSVTAPRNFGAGFIFRSGTGAGWEGWLQGWVLDTSGEISDQEPSMTPSLVGVSELNDSSKGLSPIHMEICLYLNFNIPSLST